MAFIRLIGIPNLHALFNMENVVSSIIFPFGQNWIIYVTLRASGLYVFDPIPDPKRDEFKKYLEASGVYDALSKALLSIAEEKEKPEDALRYILQKLGVQCGSDVESLKEQISITKQEIENLQKERDDLLAKIQQYEKNEHPEDTT